MDTSTRLTTLERWLVVILIAAAVVFGLLPLLAPVQFATLSGYPGNDPFIYRLAGAATFGYAVGLTLGLRQGTWAAVKLVVIAVLTFNLASIYTCGAEIIHPNTSGWYETRRIPDPCHLSFFRSNDRNAALSPSSRCKTDAQYRFLGCHLNRDRNHPGGHIWSRTTVLSTSLQTLWLQSDRHLSVWTGRGRNIRICCHGHLRASIPQLARNTQPLRDGSYLQRRQFSRQSRDHSARRIPLVSSSYSRCLTRRHNCNHRSFANKRRHLLLSSPRHTRSAILNPKHPNPVQIITYWFHSVKGGLYGFPQVDGWRPLLSAGEESPYPVA